MRADSSACRHKPVILAFAALGVTMQARAAPPFRHIILVIQENRTPDNLFGSHPRFEPGVDVVASGTTSTGQVVPFERVPLAGCYDISHAHNAFEAALTVGFDAELLDSTSCAKPLPKYPAYAYADDSTGVVQPYFDIARNYGFANRMFQTNQGPSFPAHQFLFGGTSAPVPSTPLFAAENLTIGGGVAGCIAGFGQTVALIDGAGSETSHPPRRPCFDRPVLTDLLEAASPPVGWRYYAPMPGSIWTAPDAIAHICQARVADGVRTCTGQDWLTHVVPDNPAQVLTDIASCNLQGVSWVIPTGENSDHANLNKGTGPQWVASIVNAVGKQTCQSGESYWNDTAILIVWDDWGGWYDHVPPVKVVTDQARWGAGYTYGFRVPLLVVSAYTPAGFVSNQAYDFGSLLLFVERNFGLGFIGPGRGTFSRYADYQAAQAPFGDMETFFRLDTPRPFVSIPTSMTAQDFIDAPRSGIGPDDD